MTYLLDTNTCICYLNGKSERLRRRIESTNLRAMALCSVVKAELFFGLYKSERQITNQNKLSDFLSQFASLPFDDAAAQAYGVIRAQLERRGEPIGPNDLLIAAIAKCHGAVLVTHNLGEFQRVDGLVCEDWE